MANRRACSAGMLLLLRFASSRQCAMLVGGAGCVIQNVAILICGQRSQHQYVLACLAIAIMRAPGSPHLANPDV